MASVTVTLGAGITNVPLDAQPGKVVITIMSSPAEVYATADGTNPAVPSSTEIITGQVNIAGVLGGQGVLQPPFPGGHMNYPVIKLSSAGTPTVEVKW